MCKKKNIKLFTYSPFQMYSQRQTQSIVWFAILLISYGMYTI